MMQKLANILRPLLRGFVVLGLLVVLDLVSPIEIVGGALGFALEATLKTFLPLVAMWTVVDWSVGRAADNLAQRLKG